MIEQSQTERTRKIKRGSAFYLQANKPKLKNLLQSISDSYDTHRCRTIQDVIQQRKQKLFELDRLKAKKIIWQAPIRISSKVQQKFSDSVPISIGDTYVEDKIRNNILSPSRFWNPQPNMKAGSQDQSKMISFHDNNDKRVIDQKFQEYVRIVQEQSGSLKRKRLKAMKIDDHSLPTIKSPKKSNMNMKKTYFKKYASDLYNFYKPPVHNISRIESNQSYKNRQDTERSSLQRSLSQISSTKEYKTLTHDIEQSQIPKVQKIKKYTSISKTLDPYLR